MNNTISNWNGTDYRSIYLRQLKENPIYFDQDLNTWIVYSYAHCKTILHHSDALVPELPVNDKLNEKGRLLINKMVRLSNGEQHHAFRAAAMTVFQKLKNASTGQLLKELLADVSTTDGFDWVEVVAKQLPIRLILKGLDFDNEDSNYIAANLQSLARIMLPNKTERDIQLLNPVVEVVYYLAEKYACRLGLLTGENEMDEMAICNLIGLFIQSYDAGRGLLCNSLLNRTKCTSGNGTDWKKLVNETLRYDPPVHNTRRVAARDISIGGQTIKERDTVMVVLAAANLDDSVFIKPDEFDVMRSNNHEHLTFGLGGHNCVAKYFCIDMAVDVCRFIADNYPRIRILQKEFIYEPQLNVRLVKQLMVGLS